MDFVVVASLEIKREHLAEFTRRIRVHASNSVASEPGCIGFEVCIDRENPHRMVLYEVYVDQAAFDAHLEMPFMQKHMQETAAMMAREPELIGFFDRLPTPSG